MEESSTSIRRRVCVVAAATAFGVAAIASSTTLAMVQVDLGGAGASDGTRAGAAIGAVTLIVLMVLGATFVIARALAPLGVIVDACREVERGRHPDEAFVDVEPSEEAVAIAGSVRSLALRLRELDATDRRFLMSISHELRTPLTAIAGHAQLIEDGIAADDAARDQSLGVIRREASRLERLVEDIVDLTRLRSNRFQTVVEEVWVDELGEHVLAIFADADPSGPRIHGSFEQVMLHSDGQRILQIVRNLVTNALRHADGEIEITGHRERGHVRFAVRNDGEPISAERARQIFEPFVGTKREGGMGLGLTIGRELAWALGGNLGCTDRGDGAEFELVLPLEPPGFGR